MRSAAAIPPEPINMSAQGASSRRVSNRIKTDVILAL
jgi:hypothetical protein